MTKEEFKGFSSAAQHDMVFRCLGTHYKEPGNY